MSSIKTIATDDFACLFKQMVKQVFKVVYGAGAGQISEVAALSVGLTSHCGTL